MKRGEESKAWADAALLKGWDEAFDGEALDYCKREFTAEQRQAAEDKGHAMPGGGFPINNVSDLHNAIQAIGRAKNPGAAKAHIKQQAERLGRSDLIPDTWKRLAKTEDEFDLGAIELPVEKTEAEEIEMKLSELEGLISKQIADVVPGLLTEAINKTILPEVTKTITEAIKKANATPGSKGRMASNPNEPDDDGSEERKEAEDDCDAETKKQLALATLPSEVRKIVDEADANAKLVKKFMEKEELTTFNKRAVEMGLKSEDGILLQKAYKGDAASQKVLEERLSNLMKAAKEQAETGNLFKEWGSGQPEGDVSAGNTAYGQLVAKAQELKKAEPKLSEAQAFTKVVTDPANRELALREKRERLSQITGGLAVVPGR